jgi:catechol 2,3-dioxygenase-like lactoylglutathione lyase family enzyme
MIGGVRHRRDRRSHEARGPRTLRVGGVFDHVTIRVADREASERFYATVLGAVGIGQTHSGGTLAEWDDFSLAAADADHPVTRRLHVGFAAPSRDLADAFWRAGIAAGHRDGGAPGPRPAYQEDYYGGFLLDPDGNSAEAVHHALTPERSGIDHLWVRVADPAAARRLYETIAPYAGFEVSAAGPGRVHCAGRGGSFSLVAGGEPTVGVHIAFPATERAAADAFHRSAIAAGYLERGSSRALRRPGSGGRTGRR